MRNCNTNITHKKESNRHVAVAGEIKPIVDSILAGTSTSVVRHIPSAHQLTHTGLCLCFGGETQRVGAPFTVNQNLRLVGFIHRSNSIAGFLQKVKQNQPSPPISSQKKRSWQHWHKPLMPNSLRLSSSVNRSAALPHATHAAPATASVRLRPKRLRLRLSLKLSIAFIVYILYRHQPHPSTPFGIFFQKSGA